MTKSKNANVQLMAAAIIFTLRSSVVKDEAGARPKEKNVIRYSAGDKKKSNQLSKMRQQ